MSQDQQARTNRRTLIDPVNIPSEFPRAFFKTVAGPGSTPYPTAPASVYYCCRQKNVSYTETPGNQVLNSTDTNDYEYLFNLEPAKFIELGSKIWGFMMGPQWFTIDKVSGNFVTHRKYDIDGNLLWSRDHGGVVNDVVTDGSGNVYVTGYEADDGAYARRYDPDGTLSLSIPIGGHDTGTGIAVDSGGNILVLGGFTARKYDSAGAFIWESSSLFSGGIAMAAADGFYVGGGQGGAGGDFQLFDSSGAFVRYASGGHGSSGRRVSSRVSESTAMSTCSGRWNADLATKFSTYNNGDCYGIDHSGSSVWYATLGDITVNSAAKWSVDFGTFPATYEEDWNVAQRGTSVIEWDIALFNTGNASVLVCGDRYSDITHQARDSADGSLLWERDHGGQVNCCAGATDSVVIGGARVPA